MGNFWTYILENFRIYVRFKMMGKPYEAGLVSLFYIWIELVSEREGRVCTWEQQSPNWLVVIVALSWCGMFCICPTPDFPAR
jgi:hypothetical protein